MTCGGCMAVLRGRPVPETPSGPAEHCGWMRKKGGCSLSRYLRRYFALHGRLLYYYARDDPHADALGVIDLCGASLTQNSDGPHGFYLVGSFLSRDYALLTPTAEQKRQWCRMLMRAITEHTTDAAVRSLALSGKARVPQHLPARVGAPLCTGRLNKLGRRTKRWVRRWYELRGPLLFHSDPGATDAVLGVLNVHLAEAEEFGEDEGGFRFTLTGPNLPRVVNLAARTPEERDTWLAALRTAAALAPSPSGAPPEFLLSPRSGASDAPTSTAASTPGLAPLCGRCRVTGPAGAVVRQGEGLHSRMLRTLEQGAVVLVSEVVGTRARITEPCCGWVSTVSCSGCTILRPERAAPPDHCGGGSALGCAAAVGELLREGPCFANPDEAGAFLEKLDFATERLADALATAPPQSADDAEDAEGLVAEAGARSRQWHAQLAVARARRAPAPGLPDGVDAGLRALAAAAAAAAASPDGDSTGELRTGLARIERWLARFRADFEEYDGAGAVADEVEDALDAARRALDGGSPRSADDGSRSEPPPAGVARALCFSPPPVLCTASPPAAVRSPPVDRTPALPLPASPPEVAPAGSRHLSARAATDPWLRQKTPRRAHSAGSGRPPPAPRGPAAAPGGDCEALLPRPAAASAHTSPQLGAETEPAGRRGSPAARLLSSLSASLGLKRLPSLPASWTPSFRREQREQQPQGAQDWAGVDAAAEAAAEGEDEDERPPWVAPPPLPVAEGPSDGGAAVARSPTRPEGPGWPPRCPKSPEPLSRLDGEPRKLLLAAVSRRADACRERLMQCVNSGGGSIAGGPLDREVGELRYWAETARAESYDGSTPRDLELEAVLASVDAAHKLYTALTAPRGAASPDPAARGRGSPALSRHASPLPAVLSRQATSPLPAGARCGSDTEQRSATDPRRGRFRGFRDRTL